MKSPAELREQARHLMSTAKRAVDRKSMMVFAGRAYELSQLAELLENQIFDPKLLRSNLARYRLMLAGNIGNHQRELIREALADAKELADNRITVFGAGDLEGLSPRLSLWLVYQYWLKKCCGRSLPDRRSLYPIDRQASLGWISLIDVTDNSRRFQYRLISEQLTRRLGYEMTGRYVEDIPDDKTKTYVQNLYAEAVDTRVPLYERSKRFFSNRSWEHEVLVLPFAPDDGAVDMLMVYRETYEPKRIAA